MYQILYLPWKWINAIILVLLKCKYIFILLINVFNLMYLITYYLYTNYVQIKMEYNELFT